MLSIHTGKLQQALTLCSQTDNQIRSLSYFFYDERLRAKAQELQYESKQLSQYLTSSIASYEASEETVKELVDAMTRTTSQIFQGGSVEAKAEPFWETSFKEWKTYKRFHTSLSSGKSIKDYLKNGVCFGVFGSVHALDMGLSKHMKYMDMSGNLRLGNLEASADAKFQLYNEDDQIDPSVDITAKAIACLGEVNAKAGLGGSIFHVDAEATGRVGTAKAEGEAVINKEQVTLKGEVGLAALQGDVKGTFSFLGMKITLTGSGELGAVGVGAEFSSKSGEVEFGGKASFLAGVGLKVKIEY